MDYAEEKHCDVTSAALLSMKRAKTVSYDGADILLLTRRITHHIKSTLSYSTEAV
jgi:hypothetical protein